MTPEERAMRIGNSCKHMIPLDSVTGDAPWRSLVASIELTIANAVADERTLMLCGHPKACLSRSDKSTSGTLFCRACEQQNRAVEAEQERCITKVAKACRGVIGTAEADMAAVREKVE